MKLSNQKYTKSNRELSISMTSMIDVVFLLLIFFLVTTTFVKPEHQLNSNIMVEEKNAGLQTSLMEPAIVDIYRFGDQILYKMGAVKSNQINDLANVMAGFGDKSEGGFVRVGKNVPFEHPAKVIAAFKANGFANVSYLPAK